jgi:hypothetical protein
MREIWNRYGDGVPPFGWRLTTFFAGIIKLDP